MKAQWSSLVQRARSTCVNFSQKRPTAKALHCCALVLPLSLSLSACSDMGSDAEIEVLQQQASQTAAVQRLDANTSRNSLRTALEDPRLHPFALARAMFEQSEIRAEAPAFLVQFSAVLLEAKAAPDLVDDLIDELLSSFGEISRQNEFLAEYSSIFYMRLLAMSAKTANHERTEQLRVQVEALIEAEGSESFANIELLQYYLEAVELAGAQRHLDRLPSGFWRTNFALELLSAYLDRGDYYAAQGLIDELARDQEQLHQFAEMWVELLLRADRHEEAITFVTRATQDRLSMLRTADDYHFYSMPTEILTFIGLLHNLGRLEEAREATIESYRIARTHEPQPWYVLQATLPFVKAFAQLGEPVLFNEVKNHLFSTIYQNLDEDDFLSFVSTFVLTIENLELQAEGLEFLSVLASYNDTQERIPTAEFEFGMSHGFGALGDTERGAYYLQRLLDDPYRLQTLIDTTLMNSMRAVEYLLAAGYLNEVLRYWGDSPSFSIQFMLIEKLTAEQRFVDALEQVASLEFDTINEAFFLLMVAKGYLEQEILPNADAREVMARHWQRYMPME